MLLFWASALIGAPGMGSMSPINVTVTKKRNRILNFELKDKHRKKVYRTFVLASKKGFHKSQD